jgi:hypothetical protein
MQKSSPKNITKMAAWIFQRICNLKKRKLNYILGNCLVIKYTAMTPVNTTFKGQKALTFMKKMGYEFKPVQQTIYQQHYAVVIQKAPRQPSLEIRITEKSNYLKKGSYETGWSYISKTIDSKKLSTAKHGIVGRSKIYYTDNKFAIFNLKLFNIFYPDKPVVYDSWMEYPGNIEIINDFENRYGNQ